jgi:hypothetical protein
MEILIAAAISVVLAGMLLALTASALDLWRGVRSDVVTAAQAAQALDVISADLQAAIIREETATLACDLVTASTEAARHGWFTSGMRKPEGASVLIPGDWDSSAYHSARFGVGGAWLRFVTTKIDTHADARRASSPAVVSYQIVRRKVGEEPRYVLCRSIVRTGASASGAPGTFEAGHDVDAAPYNTASATAGDPGSVLTPSAIDILASDVVDFGIVLWLRDGPRLRADFPKGTGTRYRSSGNTQPVAADVVIRILDSKGARAIASLEATAPGRESDAWWRIAEQHSKTFVRRVAIERVR